MLTHPTLDLLHDLGLEGCAKGFKDLAANPAAATLDHAEWLGVLLEHEVTRRNQKLYESRARRARLRHLAVIEDVDYRAARGLDKALFLKLGSCAWIREHRNLIVTGPCGVGKTWLACALGNQACRENLSVLYVRASRLFAELTLGRGDGRYTRLLRGYGKADLLVIDDWGPEPLGADQRRDLLEIVEERYGRKSLLITSQVPVADWHAIIGNPTLGDAILDRIVHNAYRIELSGDSLRKHKPEAEQK
jgi:DNA replication protein DnaC